MDTDDLAHMYVQIVNGVPKADSQYAATTEGSATWDEVAREVEQIIADGGTPEMINEIPPAYEPTGAVVPDG